MRVKVLMENTVANPIGVCGEHGLSLLIEHKGKQFLFDTGQSERILENAIALGEDLSRLDGIIISHGHYDHTGGLKAVVEATGGCKIYAHPDIFTPRYGKEPFNRFIGVPFRKEDLESIGAEFIYVVEPMEIAPGLWISGEVPRKTDFEGSDRNLYVVEEGREKADPLRDDISLYATLKEGLLIILGCAHSGLVNIVEHAKDVTGEDRVYGIIGGTHLGLADEQRRIKTIDYLKNLNLEFIAPNHCTGLAVVSELRSIYGDAVKFASVGVEFKFD